MLQQVEPLKHQIGVNMKDEIKEILDKLLKYFKESNVNDFGYEQDKLISYEEAQILLDYITNLQEELEEEKRIEQEDLKTIQELEEKLNNLTHTIFTGRNYNEVLKSEQDYKSRNEKAIDKISKLKPFIPNEIPSWLDELENILQGSDK